MFYGRNANTAMFTNVSLTRELYGNVYTYDAKGNVTAVKDLSNQKSAATYDSFDNLLSYVQPGSATTEKYLFTYGSTDAEKKRHLPLTSTTPMGVKTATEYNAYGSAVNAVVQENTSAPLIRTETEYTEDGNFVTKQRDARGNEVVNTLDANGKLLSVTDPAGQSVNYSYDASNRMTSVQSSYTVNGESNLVSSRVSLLRYEITVFRILRFRSDKRCRHVFLHSSVNSTTIGIIFGRSFYASRSRGRKRKMPFLLRISSTIGEQILFRRRAARLYVAQQVVKGIIRRRGLLIGQIFHRGNIAVCIISVDVAIQLARQTDVRKHARIRVSSVEHADLDRVEILRCRDLRGDTIPTTAIRAEIEALQTRAHTTEATQDTYISLHSKVE